MALTRYKFTATGTNADGQPTQDTGTIEAANPLDAETQITEKLRANDRQAVDIDLVLTPGCTQ
ncbi:hypothetical protein ACIOKA_38410 [Streptomyces anulatus]